MLKTEKNYKWLIWLSLVVLFIYLVFRAYTFSLTHDESISFAIVNGDSLQRSTANNHVFNTFLMKLSSSIFGDSELSLRLPNVLAGGLYFFVVYHLVKMKSFWLALFGASVICLNPFLLEFFSLSRGYGLSFSFILMSFFFLSSLEMNNKEKFANLKNYFLALLFAFFATNANLSAINFLIATVAFLTIHYSVITFKNTKKSFKEHLPYLLLLLVGCVIIYFEAQRLLLLQKNNQLYFGEPSFANMFQSISLSSIYNFDYFDWTVQLLKYFVFFTLGIGAAIVIWKKEYNKPLFAVLLLIVIIFLGLFIESKLFEAKFPSGRSAFYLVPILSVYFFLLIERLTHFMKPNFRQINPFLAILCLPLFINFYSSLKTKTTKDWAFDSRTKEVMTFVQSNVKNKKQKATIANNWLFEPSINYYINSRQMNLEPATRNPIEYTTDFIYRLDDNSEVKGYHVILDFPEINANLLQKIPNFATSKIKQ